MIHCLSSLRPLKLCQYFQVHALSKYPSDTSVQTFVHRILLNVMKHTELAAIAQSV